MLLDAGGSSEATERTSEKLHKPTALLYASMCPFEDNMQVLVEDGSDKNVKDKDGKTALLLARHDGAVMKLLNSNRK